MIEITNYNVFYYGGLERPDEAANQYQRHRRAIIHLTSDKKYKGRDVRGHISFWDRIDIPNFEDSWGGDDQMVYFDIPLNIDHLPNVIAMLQREKSITVSRAAFQNVIQGENEIIGQ